MMDQMKNLGQRKTSLFGGELETDTKNSLVSVNTETHREGSTFGKRADADVGDIPHTCSQASLLRCVP